MLDTVSPAERAWPKPADAISTGLGSGSVTGAGWAACSGSIPAVPTATATDEAWRSWRGSPVCLTGKAIAGTGERLPLHVRQDRGHRPPAAMARATTPGRARRRAHSRPARRAHRDRKPGRVPWSRKGAVSSFATSDDWTSCPAHTERPSHFLPLTSHLILTTATSTVAQLPPDGKPPSTHVSSSDATSLASLPGVTAGACRDTTRPSRPTRNLVKFHLIAPERSTPGFSPFRY